MLFPFIRTFQYHKGNTIIEFLKTNNRRIKLESFTTFKLVINLNILYMNISYLNEYLITGPKALVSGKLLEIIIKSFQQKIGALNFFII